jgi:hypothetical protein
MEIWAISFHTASTNPGLLFRTFPTALLPMRIERPPTCEVDHILRMRPLYRLGLRHRFVDEPRHNSYRRVYSIHPVRRHLKKMQGRQKAVAQYKGMVKWFVGAGFDWLN